MWFAMFDEEFTKTTLLTEPKHYWIGPSNEYYTLKLLTLSTIKGMINSLWIFLFVFCSLNGYNVPSSDGINGDFWLSSAVLYAIVVILANLYIA